LEEQINFIVTESSTRMLKLRSTFQAARVVLEDLNREIRGFLEKISADSAVLGRLDALLETRREQMLRQVTALVREVESAYDETTKERTTLFHQELTWWRSFQLLGRRSVGQLDLHGKIETKLRQLLQPQMQQAVSKLEIDLRGLWPQMQDLLENQLSVDLQKHARQSVPDFAGQRRELSESIQAAFIDILAGKTLQERLARSYSQTALSLRVVVALIAIAGAVAVFARARSEAAAMGALIVAGIGAVLAIFLAFNHRRRVLRDYEQQLSPKRTEFSQNLEKQFAKAIDAFCAEMAKKFQDLKEICQTQRRSYEPWSQRAEELQTKFTELKPRLG
jgi:vacuolar-type H+-ATPase subunit D/Vma8